MEPGNPATLAQGFGRTGTYLGSLCAHPPPTPCHRFVASLAGLCPVWSLVSRVGDLGCAHRDWLVVRKSLAQASVGSRNLDQVDTLNLDSNSAAPRLAPRGTQRNRDRADGFLLHQGDWRNRR